MSLLEALTLAQDAPEPGKAEEGSANISDRFRCAQVEAIKQCPLSRWEIAGKMSHLLGLEITKYQIDTWTSESKDRHRMPGEFIPAFCLVTGCMRPMQVLNEIAGLFALPGADALRAEIQRLDEEERRIKAEKRKRSLFLNEIEGKNGEKL